MGEWENLPVDLLTNVVDRLSLYEDKVRLACVCKSWKSSASPNISVKFPLLLVQCAGCDDRRATHALVDVVEKTSCFLNLHNHLNQGKIFCGSSYGWLISVEIDPSICLINPLTKDEIKMPPRSTFPDALEYHIGDDGRELSSSFVRDMRTRKIILSSNPSLTDDYIAIAIYGNSCSRLAYRESRDDKWSEIGFGLKYVYDIIYYNGELHALTFHYELMMVVIGSYARVTEKTRRGHDKFIDSSSVQNAIWSVESKVFIRMLWRLLMVVRDGRTTSPDPPPGREEVYLTSRFLVFKFEEIERQWKLITDVGNNVLFLGLNTSVSLSVSQLPGVRRNTIYFTDDYPWLYGTLKYKSGYDSGMFDLETGELKPLPGYECNKFAIHPPIWILSYAS